jgi:hypothetical protein
MPHNATCNKLADKHGLQINSVSWEDNARDKNSSFGPCITGLFTNQIKSNNLDMTLQLQDPHARLPSIRHPNFADLTWDVPIEQIPLIVGNEVDETGQIRYSVTLREYLSNFPSYLTNPKSFNGKSQSLLKSGEKCVVMSSQACFLPVPIGVCDIPLRNTNLEIRRNHPNSMLR